MTAQEAKRNYKREWRAKNRERINARQREWRKENRDRVRQYDEKYWNGKAEERGKAEGGICACVTG